jgi:bacteriocin-like protein
MNRKCEIDLLSGENNQLSDNELDAVSGGRIRWIDIHMPYNDFIKWKGGDPSPTRLA